MDKNNSHLAGEYYVAAELYRRGYSVAMTLGNAKTIDLMAVTEYGKTINVQVKAIHSRKRSICWNINSQDVKDDVWYIFVDLRCDSLENIPSFYIGEGQEVRELVKMPASGRGYIDVSFIHDNRFLNRWDKLPAVEHILTDNEINTLHEAMVTVLSEQPGKTAHRRFLSNEIYRRALYRQPGGEKATVNQINARVSKKPEIFELAGKGNIRLR